MVVGEEQSFNRVRFEQLIALDVLETSVTKRKATPTRSARAETSEGNDVEVGNVGEAQSLIALLIGLATSAAERYAAGRKDHIADVVVDIAANIRRSGRQFEGQQDWLADAIDRAAGKVRDKAEMMRETEVRQLLSQGRTFARARPRLFLACSALGGILVASVMQ